MFYEQSVSGYLDLLDFRNETTWKFQEEGRNQAKETLEMGEGTGFRALSDWVSDRDGMKQEWGTFGNYLKSFLPQM